MTFKAQDENKTKDKRKMIEDFSLFSCYLTQILKQKCFLFRIGKWINTDGYDAIQKAVPVSLAVSEFITLENCETFPSTLSP